MYKRQATAGEDPVSVAARIEAAMPLVGDLAADRLRSAPPVSYTHLTLPTSDLVEISVVAVSLKKTTRAHYTQGYITYTK